MNGAEPKTLDPSMMTGEPEGRVATEIFEGLTRLEARSLEPVPGVAESWDITPDGKTYTFHLRANARWSDGRPLTADDFAYSWRRLQDPALGAEYAYIMHMVRYAEALNTHQGSSRRVARPGGEGGRRARSGAPERRSCAGGRGLRQRSAPRRHFEGHPEPRCCAHSLLRKPGDLPSAELGALREQLALEGRRRRALFEAAKLHYGVDGGVFARDPQTLVVELNAPTPYFLELTAFLPLISRAALGDRAQRRTELVFARSHRVQRPFQDDRVESR